MVLRQEPLEQETSFSEMVDNDNNINNEEIVDEEEEEQQIYLHIYDYEADAFSSVTTYHGMVRIYNARTWPSRIFWIVTVLCWLSMFVVHSSTLLWAYNQHETEVVITTIVPENGVQFPAVTLCNLNPVARSKVAVWNMSDVVLNYLLKSYPEIGKLEPFATTERYLAREHDEYLKFIEEYKSNTGEDFELGAFFYETGHTCEDMVLSCKWAGKKISNCCDFAVSVTTDLGRCMTFSDFNTSDGGQRQKISGASYGFHILMDVRIAEHRGVVQQTYMDAGVRLFVHPQNTLPYLHTSGVAAAPGTKVYGSVKLKNMSLLPQEEWGSCLNEWNQDVHGEVLVGRNYTSAHCEANCVANIYWSKCNCVPLSKQFNSRRRVCTPFELRNCSHNEYLRRKKRGISEEIYSNCGCRTECNRLEYKTTAQHSAITATYRHLHSQYGVSQHYVRENFIAADVFMGDIVYEEHKESAQNKRVEILGKIGGSIGLFLGVSVITLFEIFIFLFKSAWGAVSVDRQKRFARKEQKIIEKELDALEKRILPPDDISVILESAGNDDAIFQEHRPSWPLARRASEIPRVSRRASQAVTYINRPRTASDQDKSTRNIDQPSTSKQSDPFEDIQFAIENHGDAKPTIPVIAVDHPEEGEARQEMDERVATVQRVRSNEGTTGNPMVKRPSRIYLRRSSTARGTSPTRRESLRKMVLKQRRARHLSEQETEGAVAAEPMRGPGLAAEPESAQIRRPSTTIMLRRVNSLPKGRTRHISETQATDQVDSAPSARKASVQSTQSTKSKNSDILLTIVDHRRPSVAAWSRQEQIHHLRRPVRPLLRRPARTMVVERRPSQAMPTIIVRTGGAEEEERRGSQMSSQLHRSASVGRRPSKTPSAAGSSTDSHRASSKDIHLAVVNERRRLSVAPAMFRRPTPGQVILRRPSRAVIIEQRRPSVRPSSPPPVGDEGVSNPIQQEPQKAGDRRPSNIHLALVHDRKPSPVGRRQSTRPGATGRSPSRLAAEQQPSTSSRVDTTSDIHPLCEEDDE